MTDPSRRTRPRHSNTDPRQHRGHLRQWAILCRIVDRAITAASVAATLIDLYAKHRG